MENLMLSNIIVGGGNSLIPGFSARLKHEIENGGLLTDQVSSINIHQEDSISESSAVWRGLKSFS